MACRSDRHRVWRRQASYPQRVAIAGSPVGLGCDQQPRTGDHPMTDDRIGPAQLVGEERRRRSAARDDRLCRRAPDGARGAGPDRRRLWRESAGSAGAAQRLPRSGLGDPGRHGRAAHPQAQEGQLLPGLPGAAAGGREGAHGGDPGGLRAGHLDPLGRRGWSRRSAWPGSPRARSAACATRSTSGCGPSSSARSKGTGPICGSMRPT